MKKAAPSNIFRKQGQRFWHADIMVAGRRFRGSLRTESRSVAKEKARLKRLEMEREAATEAESAARPPDMTFDEAAQVYWYEHGKDTRDAEATDDLIERAVSELVGPDTMCSAIDGAMMKAIRAKLRVRQAPRGRGRQLVDGLYKARSINKYLDIVMRILTNAEIHLDIRFPAKPDVGRLKLREKVKPRSRFLKTVEEAALAKVCSRDFMDFLEFDLETGYRADTLSAALWDDIDWDREMITLPVKDKGRDPTLHEVHLTERALEILDRRMGTHDVHIFTTVAARTHWNDGIRVLKGERIVLNYAAAEKLFRKARTDAGIADLVLHDIRRTAGRRVFEEGGVDEAQVFLGHADRQTTLDYLGLTAKDIVRVVKSASARAHRARLEADEAQNGELRVPVRGEPAERRKSRLVFAANRQAKAAAGVIPPIGPAGSRSSCNRADRP